MKGGIKLNSEALLKLIDTAKEIVNETQFGQYAEDTHRVRKEKTEQLESIKDMIE